MSASSKLRSLLTNKREFELSVTGRISKKQIPRPVWFALRKNSLLLLPVSGSSTQWYKNVVKSPQITVRSGSVNFNGEAKLLRDKKDVQEVVRLFQEKYGKGDVAKYYTTFDVAVQLEIP